MEWMPAWLNERIVVPLCRAGFPQEHETNAGDVGLTFVHHMETHSLRPDAVSRIAQTARLNERADDAGRRAFLRGLKLRSLLEMAGNTQQNGSAEGELDGLCEASCELAQPPVTPLAETDAPIRLQRDRKTGRFLPGNGAAVKTAQRAMRAALPDVLQMLQASAEGFLTASLTDDGGAEDMPARRRAQHAYRASLHLRISQLNAAFEGHGLFDRRGRLRVAWLTKLETLIREARAIDQLLGLTRETKRVPALADYIAARAGGKDDA